MYYVSLYANALWVVQYKNFDFDYVTVLGAARRGSSAMLKCSLVIFRARPADSSLSLGQVYIRRSVNWVIVGVNYIISYLQR